MLRLNMDETSLCLWQGQGKGTVFIDKKRQLRPVQNVSRAKRRCCMTHVAFICDRAELQPLLPQVIVGNEATFSVRAFAALRGASPANVHLVRQKSAWNNEALCAMIIRWLGVALRQYCGELQPVLLLDAAKLHFTRRVLAACAAAGVVPVLVPAKLTWLLQPLDTHAFQPYKAFLQEAYQQARAASANGDLDIAQFLACVYGTIKQILEGREWAAVFDKDGFASSQAMIRATIQDHLQISVPFAIPDTCPSDAQLQVCFPKRSRVPVAALWRPLIPKAKKVAGPGAPPIPLAMACSGEAVEVKRYQTRYQSRKAVAEAKAEATATKVSPKAGPVAVALPLPKAFGKMWFSAKGGGASK